MKRLLCLLLAVSSIWLVCASARAVERVLIDVGERATQTISGPPPTNFWNNITNLFNDGSYSANVYYWDLVDTNNVNTGMDIIMSNWYPGSNQNGPATNTYFGDDVYPGVAVRDNAFTGFGAGASDATSYVYFTSLEVTKTYVFTFFASRTGVSDNRETRYQLSGDAGTSTSVFLNTANNYTQRATTGEIKPNASGQILLLVGPGPNNNVAAKYSYLGVVDITIIPEPMLLGMLPLLALALRRR